MIHVPRNNLNVIFMAIKQNEKRSKGGDVGDHSDNAVILIGSYCTVKPKGDKDGRGKSKKDKEDGAG